jgi:dipeptidyl aminopeptidase/acylaminoacyl peptidase
LLLPVLVLQVGLAACSAGSAAPVAQPVARASASPQPTALPTPSQLPVIPLSISSMRVRDYFGSDLQIDQTLAAGANYHRYIASYRSDGLKINGLLTVPNGARPAAGWPAIIFNHGYIPPAEYRPTERYIAYVDAFARDGYIVFRPDYRGNGFSEGEAASAYGAPDYTIDVLNALASVKRYPDTDPKRIGMWGHSLGGTLTLRSLVISSDIRAAVIWAGVVAPYADLLSKWHPKSPPTGSRFSWRQDFVSRYGSPEQSPEFWNSISPNSFLADVTAPVQLHHGTADEEVPLEFSQTLEQELKAAGKTVEFYSYPGNDHNISGSFGLAMDRSVAFFDRYLKAALASSTPSTMLRSLA